jgi:hypothetical protein
MPFGEVSFATTMHWLLVPEITACQHVVTSTFHD